MYLPLTKAQTQLLTVTEEVELARRRQAGDQEARATLIERNIRLAARVAQPWARRYPHHADEIESEALLGLIRAVDRFDPERGVRFSTYATYWIKQFCQRWIYEHSRLIHIPVAFQDGSPKPSSPECHAAANQIRAARYHPITTTLGGSRRETKTPDPARLVAAADTQRVVREEALALTGESGEVIRRRYGLDDGAEAETIAAINQSWGVSRAGRARGIHYSALATLAQRLKARGVTP